MVRRKARYSRLTKREKKKYTRQTLLVGILTLFLIIAIIFWGIPSLIKVAIFLSDIKSSTQPISGQDSLPPPPPVLQPLMEATHSATIRVEGFAEEGSTVILSINASDAYEVLVESDGEFLFNKVQLNEGNNKISARSIDAAGNESRSSFSYNVLNDSIPPELTVTSPEDGKTFYGQSEKNIKIQGNVEEDSRVRINGSFVILSQENEFSSPFTLSQGENIINIVARDNAGNENIETRTVTYEE